jgi:hypothetical protein
VRLGGLCDGAVGCGEGGLAGDIAVAWSRDLWVFVGWWGLGWIGLVQCGGGSLRLMRENVAYKMLEVLYKRLKLCQTHIDEKVETPSNMLRKQIEPHASLENKANPRE